MTDSTPHEAPTSATAAPDTSEVTVVRNDDKTRYEILVDHTHAGFTRFREDSRGHFVFDHTIIDPAFSGRGLGKTLVSEAMGDVARRGEVVVPVCPFVVRFLKENDVAGLIVDWPHTDDAAEAATPGESPA